MEEIKAYCLKCKSKQVIESPEKSEFKNGTPILKGKCASCGGTLFKIVSRKAKTE